MFLQIASQWGGWEAPRRGQFRGSRPGDEWKRGHSYCAEVSTQAQRFHTTDRTTPQSFELLKLSHSTRHDIGRVLTLAQQLLSVDATPSHRKINGLRVRSTCRAEGVTPCYNREFMTEFVLALLVALRVFFRTRHDTALEVLALRHQVAVLKRKRPRPPLNSVDRFFGPPFAASGPAGPTSSSS